jgi:hypothetical protein
MFRFKTIFGDGLMSRIFEIQAVATLIKSHELNMRTGLGMPITLAA